MIWYHLNLWFAFLCYYPSSCTPMVNTKNGINMEPIIFTHEVVTKWKHFPRYWPFVHGIHHSPVNSPHKGQWRGALMFSLICTWTNCWANNGDAGDLRRHRAHYDVIVLLMIYSFWHMHKMVLSMTGYYLFYVSLYVSIYHLHMYSSSAISTKADLSFPTHLNRYPIVFGVYGNNIIATVRLLLLLLLLFSLLLLSLLLLSLLLSLSYHFYHYHIIITTILIGIVIIIIIMIIITLYYDYYYIIVIIIVFLLLVIISIVIIIIIIIIIIVNAYIGIK